MRYENVLKHTNGCGIHRLLFIIFVIFGSMKQAITIGVIIFQIQSPILECASTSQIAFQNQSLRDDKIVRTDWCKTNENTTGCKWGYYSNPTSKKSIVQEWNLCDNELVLILCQTAAIMCLGIAGSVGGLLSDRYGRVKVMITVCILTVISIVAKSFSVNVWMFMVFNGMTNGLCGVFVPAYYTYINEVVFPKQKRIFEFLAFISFSLAYCICAGFAYVFPSWRDLERMGVIFEIVIILVILAGVHESPKWLFVTGNAKSAKSVLHRITSLNCQPRLDDEVLNDIVISKEDKTLNPCDIASSVQLMKNTVSSITLTTLAVMVYYIITWNPGKFLKGSIYVNTIIMGLTEIPNSFIFLILVKYFSKKWLIMSAQLFCGGTLVLGAIISHFCVDDKIVSEICIFLSRMAANFTHCALFSFVPELFPTSLRSFGMGITNLGSRIFTAPMPYILLIPNKDSVLIPSIIMGTLVIIGTSSLFWLPNTYKCRLPDTLEESRNFKRGKEHLFRLIEESLSIGNEVDNDNGCEHPRKEEETSLKQTVE